MPTITRADVIAQARTIYAKSPDATNGGECVYTREDGGHCLASQILVNLGAPVPVVADGILNGQYLDALVSDGWFERHGHWKMEGQALNLLVRLQTHADTGFTGTVPWRVAIESAFYNDHISLQ